MQDFLDGPQITDGVRYPLIVCQSPCLRQQRFAPGF